MRNGVEVEQRRVKNSSLQLQLKTTTIRILQTKGDDTMTIIAKKLMGGG